MKKFHHKKIIHPPNKLLPLRKRLNKYQYGKRLDKIMGRMIFRSYNKEN